MMSTLAPVARLLTAAASTKGLARNVSALVKVPGSAAKAALLTATAHSKSIRFSIFLLLYYFLSSKDFCPEFCCRPGLRRDDGCFIGRPCSNRLFQQGRRQQRTPVFRI